MNEKTTPILVVLLVVAAFAIGSMWTKIQYLQGSAPSAPAVAGAAVGPSPAAQQPTAPTAPTVSLDKIKAQFADGFIHFGDANKKVLFTEISDPSCPFCHFAGGKNPELAQTSSRFIPISAGGTYDPPVEEMRKLIASGQASFVWIYSNGHGNGELGAQAFYCANEQGKFWEAHDILMSNKGYEAMNTNHADSAAFSTLLAGVVDPGFMKTCLDSKKYAANITRDQQISAALGFNGTPDFFVNTTNFNGAVDYKTAMDPVVKGLL
jgi:protein-disulfide isomerase